MSPVEHDCGHPCCPARHDDPHRHLYRPLECPGCIELAKAERPTSKAQQVADRAAELGQRYGRPDRNTRRDRG